ncbi:MAG: NADH-quinone oxidoreductase subunit C [Bacteroidetes bacterium]|nr:MAG: NADH-quinone oxidoreductase subunit C [Bacteroidota bacterium]
MSENNLHNEQKLLNLLEKKFILKGGSVRRERRVEVKVEPKEIVPVLLYAKENSGYTAFTHMSCVDWIEDGEFEVVYILWHPEEKINFFVKTRVSRDNGTLPNIDFIWRQANTYEREIREMFGIQFEGLVGREEFILEDWEHMPPMRRDFDTVKFVEKTYFERPGREDAKDVREYVQERTDEELPDFAKKYSRD